MGKSKAAKSGQKPKAEVKSHSTVKAAGVTKSSKTPVAKSKKIAKDTAAKVNGKHSKKVKKAATPSSDESDSASSASDEEVPMAVTNGKTNGKIMNKKTDASDSESASSASSESDSASDSEAEAPKATINGKMNGKVSSKESTKAISDSESNDSSEDESDEETGPVAAAKGAAGKAADVVKNAFNGTAKAVAKATKSSDDSADSASDSESGSSDSSASDDDSETEAPSKKRKAEPEVEKAEPTKKAKTEGSETGSKNLFVGNLSWNVDEDWLAQEFKKYGEIAQTRIITDKATGRSKGFGYVEFTEYSAAAAALAGKKDAELDGRKINVDFSTPRPTNGAPKDNYNSRAQQHGDSLSAPSDTLFVGNIAFSADENIIGAAFHKHGTVVNVRLPTKPENGEPKGFGYVTFDSIDSAKSALEAMKGEYIEGRAVRLDFATPRSNDGGGGRGGGRGGFDRGGRGGGRGRGGSERGGREGGRGGGRGGSYNRGGFADFAGKKQTFS